MTSDFHIFLLTRVPYEKDQYKFKIHKRAVRLSQLFLYHR